MTYRKVGIRYGKKYYVHSTLEKSNGPPHSRRTVNGQSGLFTVLPKSTNFTFQSKAMVGARLRSVLAISCDIPLF